MSHPGIPQTMHLGSTAPASQPNSSTKIVMLQPDQLLCQDLLNAGFPQAAVLEIAESLSMKITYLAEVEGYRAQNGDLLRANQDLLARAEAAETELRKLKAELKSREDDTNTEKVLPG